MSIFELIKDDAFMMGLVINSLSLGDVAVILNAWFSKTISDGYSTVYPIENI